MAKLLFGQVVQLFSSAGRTDIDVHTKQLVLCKDCKYRGKINPEKPNVRFGFNVEYSEDSICPYHCDDPYYNYYPDDNWYCANGEMKE